MFGETTNDAWVVIKSPFLVSNTRKNTTAKEIAADAIALCA
jgi:hypothetical protein